EGIVSTVREPLAVLDRTHRIQTANGSFQRSFGLSQEEAKNLPIYETAGGKLEIPKLHDLLDNVAKRGNELREIEIECELGRSARVFAVNARSIYGEDERGLIL